MREPKTETTDVRQGSKRKTNFRVLIGSAILLAAAAAGLYALYMRQAAPRKEGKAAISLPSGNPVRLPAKPNKQIEI